MNKNEIEQIILSHLQTSPQTQLAAIRHSVEKELEKQGKCGEIVTRSGSVTHTRYEPMSKETAMFINEIIWDLIIERILTPGIDSANPSLPWISVTNLDKFQARVKSASEEYFPK